MSTSPPPYFHSQLCVCVCLPMIGSITFILCSLLMSNNDKQGRQSVDNNHRDASRFSRPSAGFFKCCQLCFASCCRAEIVFAPLAGGLGLSSEPSQPAHTHSQTVGIKASSVPSVAFCAKSSLKVDKSRLSSHNAGGYVRRRRTGNIDLFALDLAAAATVVTYLPVNLLCPRDSFTANSCEHREEREHNQ